MNADRDPLRRRFRNNRRRCAYLRERDGDLCWICGAPMDFDRSHRRGDEAATIDHVIPLSRMGKTNVYNLRLAHARCNNARGHSGAMSPRLAHAAYIERVYAGSKLLQCLDALTAAMRRLCS